MLWSFPERAQRASVERLTATLAAPRISAASARLIQSVAARGTRSPGQSSAPVVTDADVESLVELPEAGGVAAAPPSEVVVGASLDGAPPLLDAAARASTLAQPLPLKWMAGALSALRISPPQASQAAGP
jgi:hypothetical protein